MHEPNLLVTPVLAHDISQIVLSWWKVKDGNNLSSNSPVNTMEGQCIVLLVELGMRHHGAIHDSLVVSKDITLV